MNRTKKISSTTARLLSHTERIVEVKQLKKIRPITIHLAPTDKCNLDCEWCSVRARKMHELLPEECQTIVDKYKQLGIKSVEITGGGDPLMYDYLIPLIDYIYEQDLAIGLITNGLLLNDLPNRTLDKLTWLRISLSGVDFGMKDDYLDLKGINFPKFTGASYVVTPNTTKKQLDDITKIDSVLNFNYIRIVPDCYQIDNIEFGKKFIPDLIKDYHNFFFQWKEYKTPQECYWRYIKPFVNSDGYIYHCSTCSLFKEYFHPDWRVGHYSEIEKIYKEQVFSFDSSNCPYCFYSKQNELLADLFVDVQNPEFI